AARAADGLIKIWDTGTYMEVATIRGGSSGVGALAFLPTGDTLVSATVQGKQELGAWHAPSFAQIDAAENTRVATRLPGAKNPLPQTSRYFRSRPFRLPRYLQLLTQPGEVSPIFMCEE